MKEISEYIENARISRVYPRTLGGYRVFMYDVLTEQQTEKYFDNLTEAENAAEDWVLKK